MAAALPTPDAIQRMFRDVELPYNFVVQVISIQPVLTAEGNDLKRIKCIISDGKSFAPGIFTSELSSLITSGAVVVNQLITIKAGTVTRIADSPTMAIIVRADPVPLEDGTEPSTIGQPRKWDLPPMPMPILIRSSISWNADCALPPWNVLLSCSLPCAYGWGPRDMLLLRSACSELRGSASTQQFFFALLSSLGVRGIEQGLSARRLYTLCRVVWAERVFVHTTAALPGLRHSRDSPCVVAGSHALHRMLTSDGEVAWKPGDMDAFVSGTRTPWTAQEHQEHEDHVHRARQAHECGALCAHGAMCQYQEPPDLDKHGRHTNDSVEAVVERAEAFLRELYPGYAIVRKEKEGYAGWARATTLANYEVDRADNYTHAEVRPVLAQFAPQEWQAALESQMPSMGGAINARPHQLGRIIEVSIDGPEFAPTLLEYGDASGWSASRSVNVIELVSERVYSPIEVTSGFDMVQCGVAMLPHGDAGLRFVHSDETSSCIHNRELRFTRYMLGPLPLRRRGEDTAEPPLTRDEALGRIVHGLLVRALKYGRRGFVPLHDGARAPTLRRHSREGAFEESMRARPRADQLVVDAFDKDRGGSGGRRPLHELVHTLAPIIPHTLTADELAVSIARLLRGGQLIAVRLPANEEREAFDDGFPLLMSTKPRALDAIGQIQFHIQDPAQLLQATTHDYAEPVAADLLPSELSQLPTLVSLLVECYQAERRPRAGAWAGAWAERPERVRLRAAMVLFRERLQGLSSAASD